MYVALSPLFLLVLIGKGAEYAIGFIADQGNNFVRWVSYKLDWESEAIRQKDNNPDKFKKY